MPGLERDLSGLVTAVFASWNAAALQFLILRNYEKLPQDTSHDIDVLVLPHQLAQAELELVRTARRVGYELHSRVEFSPVSLFFFHPGTLDQIQFDLFHQLNWRGLTLLPASQLMDRRVNRGLFAIPHPAHEAVSNLITRLIYRGYVKSEYKSGISAAFARYNPEVESLLSSVFGRTLSTRLITAVSHQQWSIIEGMCGALRRKLVWRQLASHPLITLRAWLSDARRLLRRLRRLPGLTVVLLGPDGCGKSSTADALAQALQASFPKDKVLRIHWKPAVFLRQRRALRPATTNPHGRTPRGKLASIAALLYHWTEFISGWFIQILPALFRNGFVLIDRYHYDFIVDPRRYRLGPPASLAPSLFRLIPKPDLVVLLDAPADVLQSRKQEVPVEETRRQRQAFLELVSTLPNGSIMDASQSTESVTREITHHALEHLRQRQSKRMHFPDS